jgi:hypothetical protein
MIPAHPKDPRSRRRKWWRRGVLAFFLLLSLTLALPFLFPGAAVRYWLAHSQWRDVPLRFSAARLWPTGRLTLYGLEMDRAESSGGAGRRWLSAQMAEVDFRWADLSAQHLETLVLDNLELSLPHAADVVTAWRTMAERGITCDQIIATGHVRLESPEPWMELAPLRPEEPVPLQLVVRTGANAVGGGEDVSLILGTPETGERPFLTARFAVQHDPDATTFKIDGLNLGRLAPTFTENLWDSQPGLFGSVRPTGSARLERLILSGTATFGPAIELSLTGEVRDLDLHLKLPAGAGGGAERSADLEHFSVAAHLEGDLSVPRIQGLRLARAHCSWDSLGAAGWALGRGTADLEVDGSEIVLSDLKSDFMEARVEAIGAFDAATGVLSRGRVWVHDLPARNFRARLPEPVRRALPDAFGGALSARLFLVEFDADHLAVYVECDCPGELTFNMPAVVGPAAPATVAATRKENDLPRAILTQGLLSGTVAWNFRATPALNVAHGRFTADELLVLPPLSTKLAEGTSFVRIKSDFGISGGLFRLEDFYADLSGNGRLSAEGTYSLADGAFDGVAVNFSGVDLALVNPWLPLGWTLVGQADVDGRGSLSARSASLALSLGLGSQAALNAPDGKLTLTGTPAVASLQLTLDRPTGVLRVETGEIAGLGALEADAGFVARLRRVAAPAPDSTAAFFLDHAADGAFASLDKVSFTGRIAPAEATGTLSFSGLDGGAGMAAPPAATDSDRPALVNLSLKADLAVALRDYRLPDPATFAIKDGQFLAERVVLGQNNFSGVSGNLSVENRRLVVTLGSLAAAEGTIDGNAAFSAGGRLETLQLGFHEVSQQILFRRLYADLFSAEGLVSGSLTLTRSADNADLFGAIDLTAGRSGRLKFTRPAAEILARQTSGASPETIAQLADYPYATGKATLQDQLIDPGGRGGRGLQVTLDYARGEGVPSIARGPSPLRQTLTVDSSVSRIVAEFFGWHQSPRPVAPPNP